VNPQPEPEAGQPPVPGWLQRLADRLREPVAVPFLMAPADADGELREAAVLVLFGEGPDGPDVLLLQRSADLRSHPGQPAFPGGRVDPDDEGPIAAALREAHEETGLEPSGVAVIATLPQLWIPPSGNLVTPVLGWWRAPSEVSPVDAAEVETVARVPIAELVDPANRLVVLHPSGLGSPAFRVAGMLVWGFTGGVLSWLLELAGWAVDWDRGVVEPVPGIRG
jgi:8-oxo-dGTP pyrophosphatase MutT (NUDIX family)